MASCLGAPTPQSEMSTFLPASNLCSTPAHFKKWGFSGTPSSHRKLVASPSSGRPSVSILGEAMADSRICNNKLVSPTCETLSYDAIFLTFGLQNYLHASFSLGSEPTKSSKSWCSSLPRVEHSDAMALAVASETFLA